MNSLWARAVQAQSSCRCRLCLHSGRSIVRRATTAASRRKVTAADIFTACYTTILGTATVIDAHRKEARKKELDDKLEKARAALCSLGVQESNGQQGEESSRPDAGAVIVTTGHSRESAKSRSVISHALLQELGALSEIPRLPPLSTSWMQTQLEWTHIEAAIITEEQDPGYTFYILRDPKSTLHLQKTTTAVLQLVNQLLRCSENQRTRRKDDIEMDEQSVRTENIAWNDIFNNVLQSPYYPSYVHPSIDPDDTAGTRSLLGNSIRRIFNQAASSKEIVAKICYNILTSSAPPTIHTYNTLIAGFNRIERPDLAQMVINSYIHDTVWPATHQTMVCLLNHYRGTNEINGFRDIILRMRGVKDTGLHFRIISRDAIHSQDWLNWVTEKCAPRKYSFVQRAQRNDEIFDTIIKGWLHFGEISNASMVLIACIRTGYSVTVETLQKLLTACLATADVVETRRLVAGFAKNPRAFVTYIQSIIDQEPTTTSLGVIDNLTHLFDICWLPFKDIFDPVAKIHSRTVWKLKQLIRRIQQGLEAKETEDLHTKMLNGITSSSNTGLHNANVTLDMAQQTRQRVIEASNNFNSLGILLSIDRRYQILKAKIQTTTIMANAMILKIKTGYDFNIPFLESKERHSPYYQQRHDYLCSALKSIQIHSGPMTNEDLKLQLFQNLPHPELAKKLADVGNPENLAICSLLTFYNLNSYKPLEPKAYTDKKPIGQLKHQLAQIEDTIRAILFTSIPGQKQKRMRSLYPNWHNMSIPKLIEYNMRIKPCKVPKAASSKQTTALRSRDQENTADISIEEPSLMLDDVYRADRTIIPAAKHASPTVLHGEVTLRPFALG